MPAMNLLVLMLAPSAGLAASWSNLASKGSLSSGSGRAMNNEDVDTCVEHAKKFIHKAVTKGRAIEYAVDHCALDKKVDDRNFVCPHYREILLNAFARESTVRTFTAQSFCDVTEGYVFALKYGAANIPNMGEGAGFNFKVSKKCQPAVSQTIKPEKTMPPSNAADFWYSLCMNQDCAHFLPSRTRWCKSDHKPTHSADVCEAIRTFAMREVTVFKVSSLDAEQVCSIYDDFVEDTHINVEAYLHVVHGKREHPVPTPDDKSRALQSAQMKNEAGKHILRDSSGEPVKSNAVSAGAAVGLVALAGFLF